MPMTRLMTGNRREQERVRSLACTTRNKNSRATSENAFNQAIRQRIDYTISSAVVSGRTKRDTCLSVNGEIRSRSLLKIVPSYKSTPISYLSGRRTVQFCKRTTLAGGADEIKERIIDKLESISGEEETADRNAIKQIRICDRQQVDSEDSPLYILRIIKNRTDLLIAFCVIRLPLLVKYSPVPTCPVVSLSSRCQRWVCNCWAIKLHCNWELRISGRLLVGVGDLLFISA